MIGRSLNHPAVNAERCVLHDLAGWRPRRRRSPMNVRCLTFLVGGLCGRGGPRSPWRLRRGLTVQDSVDRCPTDPEDVTDLRNGHVLLRIQPLRGLHLISRQGRGPATGPTASSSGNQTGVGALPDQVTLKLGQRREDMEDQPASRRSGVDRLLQRPEPDAAFGQHVQLIDQVPNGPAQPVKPPHDKGVPRPDLVEELVELRAMLKGPRHRVDEHPVTAGPIQGIDLQSRVLVVGGDARVT